MIMRTGYWTWSTQFAPGTVMSYGDVAEFLGRGGPRQVGRVMALWGGGVAWWRVVHADGSLLAGHERVALARYEEENTPLRRRPAAARRGSTCDWRAGVASAVSAADCR